MYSQNRPMFVNCRKLSNPASMAASIAAAIGWRREQLLEVQEECAEIPGVRREVVQGPDEIGMTAEVRRLEAERHPMLIGGRAVVLIALGAEALRTTAKAAGDAQGGKPCRGSLLHGARKCSLLPPNVLC